MAVCWGSPGPEPLGQHSLAMGRAWGVQWVRGVTGQSLGGHPDAVAMLMSPLPGEPEGPQEAPGLRGDSGDSEVVLEVEKCWKLPGERDLLGEASGRDVSPVDIDELLSLEKGSDPGSCCPVIPPGLWALLGLYVNFSEPCLSPGLFLLFCSFSK